MLTLALRYAQKYEKDYRVIWLIDCADGITARRELAELAKDLRLPFYSCLRARPDLGHGAAEALRWLDYNDGWLLIFDGVRDPAVVLPLLPTECAGHVLITWKSSSMNWKKPRSTTSAHWSSNTSLGSRRIPCSACCT